MSPQIRTNGIFVKWAVAFLAAVLLGIGGWGGKTIINSGERITSLETTRVDIHDRLKRLEWKIDRLLERRP